MKKLNLKIGQKINQLTVLDIYQSVDKRRRALFLCDCGNTKIIRCDSVQAGTTFSCGCYHIKLTSQRNYVHGDSNTRLYHIWEGVKQRCLDPNADNYHNYGGRGIEVCNEWLNSFISFRDWSINNGYVDKLTIDRIDNEGNYEPSNCRWVTIKEQSKNKRTNLKYKGEISSDASFRLGGKTRHLVANRVTGCGWSLEKAFTTPVKTKKS
jgi:hypothetical protein